MRYILTVKIETYEPVTKKAIRELIKGRLEFAKVGKSSIKKITVPYIEKED